ncbi:hypothetical protein ScPMuIL_014640 [Solemya velum]
MNTTASANCTRPSVELVQCSATTASNGITGDARQSPVIGDGAVSREFPDSEMATAVSPLFPAAPVTSRKMTGSISNSVGGLVTSTAEGSLHLMAPATASIPMSQPSSLGTPQLIMYSEKNQDSTTSVSQTASHTSTEPSSQPPPLRIFASPVMPLTSPVSHSTPLGTSSLSQTSSPVARSEPQISPIVTSLDSQTAPIGTQQVMISTNPSITISPTVLTNTGLHSSLAGANLPAKSPQFSLTSNPGSFMEVRSDSTVVNTPATPAPVFGMSCPTVQPMAYIGASGPVMDQDQQKLSSNLQNLMFLQDVGGSFGTSIGTPVVVLVNNPEKGTVEANVLYQHPMSAEVILIPSNTDNATTLPAPMAAPCQQKTVESEIGEPSQSDGSVPRKDASEKNYMCTVGGCRRSFNTDWRLKYHQAIHSGVKTLECTVEGCGRKFSWPAHLHYHHLTHTGERQYKCDQTGCGKSFYTAQRLNVHKRIHTGEKPFCCTEDKCTKSFTTAGNLKNHMRIHSGEKPYQCTAEGCDRKFAEYSSLRKHKLVHSGEKPFECSLCGKTFSQSGSCKVHMARHQLTELTNQITDKGSNSGSSNSNVVLKVENQLTVLEQGDEEILQYQDCQNSETVVFSQGVSEHIVTVTTQQSEMGGENMALPSGLLGTEEVLSSGGEIHSETLETTTPGASVLVLSQPQEMVSMTTDYHHEHPTSTEEIVYTGDLLNSDLDHEEIASNISQHDISRTLSHQSLTEQSTMPHTSSTEKEVDIDPMMESDEESDMVESK